MEKNKGNYKRIILQEGFNVLSLALLSFIILEWLWPNSVLGYLNLNLLLLIWLVVGILLLVINKKNK